MTPTDEPPRGMERVLLEETIEDLYEHAPCGYLSTLPDGTIARVNQTFVDWLQHDRAVLLDGKKFQTLLTVGSRIYYETHYAPLLRMQGFANEVALDLLRADGRVMPVLANARQRRDARDQPIFNRITVFNATDRRRYEHELLLARRKAERVAKDKATLLAMLSHDIRNPLTALMGIARLLDSSGLDDAQRRLTSLLIVSSENMLHLLERVLELSKTESSSVALIEAPFAVAELVEDVVATFQAKADGKSVRLQASFDERVPVVLSGDPIALRQILTNLVDNALKFTGDGGVIVKVQTKEAALDAVTLEFIVSDTGIGIAPHAMQRIFEEFTQASEDTAAKFGGTGLGLTIARRLVELYGGRLQVSSRLGEGSTFKFSLRLAVPQRREL